MYSKQEYKDRKATEKANAGKSAFAIKASEYIDYLGGEDNINDVNNCATRLRVSVADADLLAPESAFKSSGAHGLVKNGNAIQVIIGLDVPQVRDEVDLELERRRSK